MNIAMLVLNDMRADARVTREAAALAACGHRVTVFALHSPDAPDCEEHDGVRTVRVADQGTAGWSRPVTKAVQLRRRTRKLFEAAAGERPDVVHAHDTDTLVAAAQVARRTGAMLVYDAHELYPDMLSEFGSGGSLPVQSYWKRVERRHVPGADAVVTVSAGLATELERRFGVSPVVLRNVPPLAELRDSDRLRADLDMRGDSRAIALYQGVLIPGRGLVRLVGAIAQVSGLVLAVQGFGPEEEAMRARVRELGLEDRVRFMGRIAPEDLHEYACGADTGVVIYEHTTLNNYLAGPNKLYAYLMAGLPVAASDFPGLSEVVEGDEVGVTFSPDVTESIATALQRITDDRAGMREMARRARHLAETKYNWDIEKQTLLELYERLDASRRRQ